MSAINQKVFEGAAVRDANLKKTGTVGEKKKPKKGDTRDNGNGRYTGTKWVKVDKVKEASKKAVKEARTGGGREKGSVYVGNR